MAKHYSHTVIVSPLDWGLGHAARCVPLIHAFLDAGLQVVVAADRGPLGFFSGEFGDKLAYRSLPGYSIRYARRGSSFIRILTQMPAFALSWIRENRALKKLLAETGAGFIISDNRYGLFCKGVYSVLVTHQLSLPLPSGFKWAQPLADALVRRLLSNFQACWIPDTQIFPGLAHQLSHPAWMSKGIKSPALPEFHYIGPQSRFFLWTKKRKPDAAAVTKSKDSEADTLLPSGFPSDFDLVILSGPEPQRSWLDRELSRQYAALDEAVIFLSGKPQSERSDRDFSFAEPMPMISSGESRKKMVRFPHLETESMARLILRANLVVCRPGYSSIMDLAAFGKKALMIPTPGQTEQEYLACELQQRAWIHTVTQDNIQLGKDRVKALDLAGIPRLTADFDIISMFWSCVKARQ